MDHVFVPGVGRLPVAQRPAPPSVARAKARHAEVAQQLQEAEEACKVIARELAA